MEADLTCLYKRSTWRDGGTYIVHAECKSFNYFEKRAVDRMKDLAEAFPNAVLVFSKLSESLNKHEIMRIGALARAERKKRMRGVAYSPVVILTGIELFSSRGFRDCWKGRGGLYDQFHERYFDYSELPKLADATQQLYLGLPSYHRWAEAEYAKRSKNNSKT